MLVNKFVFVGALASMALTIQTANADCPLAFSGKACDGGTGTDNCTRIADDEVECDFRPAGQGVNAFFVSPSSTDFQAYGFDGAGEKFCCEFDSLDDGCDVGEITVTIYGTDYADELRLVDTTAGEHLDCSNASVWADAGTDDVIGSPATTNNDFLYGEEDDDSIHGLAGDDTLVGGDGDDSIWGQDGADIIQGGWGEDKIKGGDGDDFLYGDEGNDKVCGDADVDSVYGGDGDYDRVTGGTGNDAINHGGLGAYDNCENDSADVSCPRSSGHHQPRPST